MPVTYNLRPATPDPNDPPYIRNSSFGQKAARSRHVGGVNVAFGDGSVRAVWTLGELLPDAFGPSDLDARQR